MDATSTAMIIVIALMIALALAFQHRFDDLKRRIATLYRIEAKLDLLLKQANIKYDPVGDLPSNIIDALIAGEKIKAIKLYREMNGGSLKDTKDFIEGVQRKMGV